MGTNLRRCEFLAQLEASRQKRPRDEEETFDLVDAVSLAAYSLSYCSDNTFVTSAPSTCAGRGTGW